MTAVLTALNRAEWALARVAGGEGALAGKYRHPAVAPHLRALQRQFPQIEAADDRLTPADASLQRVGGERVAGRQVARCV